MENYNKQYKDFQKFALSKGISTNTLDEYNKYRFKNYINPMILEERNSNIASIDIFSRLQVDRILFLNTEVCAEAINVLAAQMLWLEQQSDSDISLYCSSPGGEIYEGLKLIDVMDFIKPDVSTVCMGMVASMASVIANCGTKGKRYILPRSRYLIHQPLSGVSGQVTDMKIHVEEAEKLKEELYRLFEQNTNLSYEEIWNMCERDNILTAQQAVDYGFVDKIIGIS